MFDNFLIEKRARTDCFGAYGPSSSASLRTAAAPCAPASNLAEDGQAVEPVLLSVGGSYCSIWVEKLGLPKYSL